MDIAEVGLKDSIYVAPVGGDILGRRQGWVLKVMNTIRTDYKATGTHSGKLQVQHGGALRSCRSAVPYLRPHQNRRPNH